VNGDRSVVWISGASSGIGAALAQSVPFADARVIGIARRAPAAGEHLPADLSDPASLPAVRASFEEVIGSGELERAVFLHFAGDGAPHGRAMAADPDRYARSVQLNAASGMILGQAFLHACAGARVPAVIVMCSSPGALTENRGMAHYGAAKAALLHWTQVVRAEEPESVVLAVVPWATDTPMLRDAMLQDADENPLSGELRAASESGQLTLATPEEVAAAVWEAVLSGAPKSPLHVGPRPPEFQ
jgi:NAD(P)-dependent dehydrogenase (short-subunit alcohol dehydrogenase family)